MRRADVVRKVRRLEEARDAGVAPAAGRAPTLEDWLDHWPTTIAVRRLKPRTMDSYQSQISNHLVPHVGHHRLDRLQPEHLERAYAALEAEGLSASSVLLNHRILSRSLKVAMQRGRIARNVATLVDPPTVVRKEIVPLTATEANALIKHAQVLPNGARWTVALALGLRQGEALGLRWEDIDLQSGILNVKWALQRQKGKGLVLVEPKSNAGRRRMVLPEPLQRALVEHAESQQQARLVAMRLLGHSQTSMTMVCTHVVDELAHEAAASMTHALWDSSTDDMRVQNVERLRRGSFVPPGVLAVELDSDVVQATSRNHQGC